MMKNYRSYAGVLALVLTLSITAHAQVKAQSERFTAFAVNMTNRAIGNNSNLEIVIDRWSTDADRETLVVAVDAQGMEGALQLLEKWPRIGFIRGSDKIGNDLTFARQVPHTDGSRRIVIIRARRFGFNEVNNVAPTTDYPFTVIELHLGANGVGDGKMTAGARIKLHKTDDLVELESYAAGAVLLKDVKAAKK